MKTLVATPDPPPRNERPWPVNITTSTATTDGNVRIDWQNIDRNR